MASTDDDKQISRALDAVVGDEHLAELIKDAGDVALDAVLDSEALKGIPVLSSLFNIVGIAKRLRERFLARKLFILVTDASRIPAADRAAFGKRFEKNQKAREELFELVVHVLDEVHCAERVKMMSALFSCLVRGVISEATFRHLSEMVHYLDRKHLDLLATLRPDKPRLVKEPEVQFLALHALVVPDFTPQLDSHGFRYVSTMLGKWGSRLTTRCSGRRCAPPLNAKSLGRQENRRG